MIRIEKMNNSNKFMENSRCQRRIAKFRLGIQSENRHLIEITGRG
jgi:hypothetical protein